MNTTIYVHQTTEPLKTPKTRLPKSVFLSDFKTLELLNLENMFFNKSKENNQNVFDAAAEFNVAHNTNVGIHYFCIENDFELSSIASNKNISLEIAETIFEKTSSLNIARRTTIYYVLVCNPVVSANFELFKKVFKFINFDNSFATLTIDFIAPVASIEVLMLVLNELRRSVANKSPALKEERFITFTKSLEPRKEEITQWLKDNNSDLVGLPFSWVLKLYGAS
jgi:hypothetical protein